MIDALILFFRGIPHELTTFIIAGMPLVEVRLSVPVAIEVFKLPIWQAILISWIGSAIPAVLLPILLEYLETPCRKYIPYCNRLLDWTVVHVEKKYTKNYQAKGAFGLTLFVAIPLPMTGIWTGALAAWVFRIKKRTAIPAILLGTAIASIVVAVITLGVFGAVRFVG